MGMFKTLVLGAVGFSVYSMLRKQSAARMAGPAEPPLQRWEDEGGNVPAVNPALSTAGSNEDRAGLTTSALSAARSSAL